MVLRRPPPPPLPPGANDVLREARILQALASSSVPVPAVLATAPAGEVMDVPCFVMAYVEGVVATERLPQPVDDPAGRRRIGHALIDTLAAVHALAWREAGLADLGRPDGFLDRQLERLPRLIAQPDGAIPHRFEEVRSRLRAAMPDSGPGALLHGDLRMGNVIVARQALPRIVAVLDWELAGIGDPIADLAYTLATYAAPGEPRHALTDLSAVTLQPGFPSRAALADRYAAATGRALTRLAWYEGLQLFKLAVLFEYNRQRSPAGTGAYYADPRLVAGLLEAANRATDRGG